MATVPAATPGNLNSSLQGDFGKQDRVHTWEARALGCFCSNFLWSLPKGCSYRTFIPWHSQPSPRRQIGLLWFQKIAHRYWEADWKSTRALRNDVRGMWAELWEHLVQLFLLLYPAKQDKKSCDLCDVILRSWRRMGTPSGLAKVTAPQLLVPLEPSEVTEPQRKLPAFVLCVTPTVLPWP